MWSRSNRFIGTVYYRGCKLGIVSSVTAVGDAAFSGCDNLKSAVISTGVTSIGKYAFATISDVYYTGSEEEWNVIEFDPNVSAFVNPTIHYNYVSEA